MTYFYDLVPLGATHTGEDIFNAIVKHLENDGLMAWAERCITSISTDGACEFQNTYSDPNLDSPFQKLC